jgi:hypothetical protein
VTEGTIKTYERVLAVAKKMSPDNRESAFDSFGLLGTEFANYCDALAAAGRKPDVIAHLERVEPYWQYVLGYEMLAQVAIKIEELERAENWLKELREQNPDYVAGTILLADVLIRRGKPQEGEAVLVAAMRASELQFQSNDTEYGDTREYYQEQYTEQRMAFLRLFPERGEQALEELQLPAKLTVKKMPEGAIP